MQFGSVYSPLARLEAIMVGAVPGEHAHEC